MLEFEMNKHSERRGRFLIQEIVEEVDSVQVAKNNCSEKVDKLANVITSTNNQVIMNNSKRPRHSSFIMDSKIIHTTRMDSNFYNELFSTSIYSVDGWVDFEQIWKDFSLFHVDVLEDDMEKIFQYIDKKIDESDFCMLNNSTTYPILNKLEERNKITSDNDVQDLINENEFKCASASAFKSTRKEITYLDINRRNSMPFTKTKVCKKPSNRSLILTNFACSSFVSPPVSPINSMDKMNYLIFNAIKEADEVTSGKNEHPILSSLHQKKRCMTQSEKPSIKRKFLTEEKKTANNIPEIPEGTLKIAKNTQFELISPTNCYSNTVFTAASFQFQICRVETEFLQFSNEEDGERICAICRSKVK